MSDATSPASENEAAGQRRLAARREGLREQRRQSGHGQDQRGDRRVPVHGRASPSALPAARRVRRHRRARAQALLAPACTSAATEGSMVR